MECSVCGSNAGRWHQHFNRDYGFGVCVECIAWLRGRGMPEDEILNLYGKEDVHWGSKVMTEKTMITAHQAGAAYWKRNKPMDATRESLESLARSCGWHGEDNTAWLAGFYGARNREKGETWK